MRLICGFNCEGSGYTSAPTVTISGGGGSGATATATVAPMDMRSMTWDVENRPVSITNNGITSTYVYDGNGNRVEKTTDGVTTIYINQYYEKNITTGTATSYYYLGSKLIAQNQGGTVSYIYQDSLNSTTVTSDSSGNLQSSTSYLPFGDSRNSLENVPTDRLFTGQRLDSTGLYYYGARYYDPEIGRFISSDTVVQSPANPQTLNRYTYALNNPLKFIDPTGNISEIMSIDVNYYDTYGFDTVMAALGADYQFMHDSSVLYSGYCAFRSVNPVMAQALQNSQDVVNIEFGLSIVGHTIDLGDGNVTLGGAVPGFKTKTTIHMSPNLRNADTNLLGTLEAHELWHAQEGRLSDSIREETEAYKFQYWTGVMLGIPGNDGYTSLAESFRNIDLSPTNPNLRNEFIAARDTLKGASGSAGVMYGRLPNEPQRGFVKEWAVIASMGLNVTLAKK